MVNPLNAPDLVVLVTEGVGQQQSQRNEQGKIDKIGKRKPLVNVFIGKIFETVWY